MRVGPEVVYEDKVDQLSDWTAQSGAGIMGITGGDLPEGCKEFIYEQYNRFKIPVFSATDNIISACMETVVYVVDSYEPYSLLLGASDVSLTEDWCNHTFEILGNPVETADPEWLETFKFVPGQAEEQFNFFMSNPGLKNLPGWVGELLGDYLHDNHHIHQELLQEDVDELEKVMGDEKKVNSYLDLAAWATFVWLAGPLGRDFRNHYHDVFCEVAQHGEAILYNGSVLNPLYYRRITRSPTSCINCGLDSWCVEMTCLNGKMQSICESCVNGHLPKIGTVDCGSRICKYIGCPNHPHANSPLGLYGVMRGRGQLRGLREQKDSLRLN